jgi:transmembrane sensor
LAKSFMGQLEPQEKSSLERWMSESPSNLQLASDMREVWDRSKGQGAVDEGIDLDADFVSLRTKIDAEENPLTYQRGGIVGRLLRIAAIGIALLAATWFWLGRADAYNFDQLAGSDGLKRIIQLEDGTEVCLKERSTLEFSSSMVDASKRKVKLRGEAFFKVAPDPKRPFQVILEDGGVVEVLGTAFDVRNYPNESNITVLVQNGKVRFKPGSGGEAAVLAKAEKATFDKGSHKLSLSAVQNYNDIAWYSEELEFVNVPLSEVLRTLEDFSKSEIKLSNPALANCTYTSPLTLKLSNRQVENLLETIALPFGIRIERTGESSFVLHGGTCPK